MTISNDSSNYFIPTIDDITFVQSDHCSCPTKTLSVDEGINYGLSFFETILVLDQPIFVEEHIQRLNHSLEEFNIMTRITKELIYEIVALCNISNKGLKILVSESNVIVSVRALTYTSEYYDKGASLMLSNIIRSSHSYLVGHKSSNYGDLILSLRNAHKLGYNDCVFFNEKGYLSESSIANIFIIKNNQLHTPALNQGLLPGVIRDYLIKTYDVIESVITIDDLVYADAIFMTNSLVGMVKVSAMDFDKTIIRQNKILQISDRIPDSMTYSDHPLFNQIRQDYITLINSK